MRPRKSLQLKSLMLVHNVFLSGMSLVLLVGRTRLPPSSLTLTLTRFQALISENVLPKLFTRGLVYSVCDADMLTDGRLELLYYLNYLLKAREEHPPVRVSACHTLLAVVRVRGYGVFGPP